VTGSRLVRQVGTALRRKREFAQLTQAQLALAAGTSQSTVAHVERGSRTPSLDLVERLFAALGVQIRIQLEPLDAEVDAAITALAATPLAERLAETDLGRLTRSLTTAGLAHVVEGAAAALVQGAPVPVELIDVALCWADADRFAAWLERGWGQRWNERWQEYGFLPLDPRLPGAHRWTTKDGWLRARMCDELPDSLEVQLGGDAYRVRPLADVEITDEHAARLLVRYRQRGEAVDPVAAVADELD